MIEPLAPIEAARSGLEAALGRLSHSQAGFTLIELMMASVLMIVVLGATLGTLDHFGETVRTNQVLNESQDRARLATENLAWELRNVAPPHPDSPAIETAEPDDLVFTTHATAPSVGGGRTLRVRYCLDGGQPGVLVRQEQVWVPDAGTPSTATCPDAAWTSSDVVADNVANRLADVDRSVWTYDEIEPDDITMVWTSLFIDDDTGEPPGETGLESGVALRNRLPVEE